MESKSNNLRTTAFIDTDNPVFYSKQKLLKTSLLLVILTISAQILAIILQVLIAAKFGASKEVDAYLIANSIPDLFISLFMVGGTIVMVPLFTQYQLEKESDVKTITDSTISLILLITIFISLFGLITASPIIKILAPRFDQQTVALSSTIFRIFMIFLFFSTLNSLSSGILHAHNNFKIPGLIRVIQFATTILMLFVLSKNLGIISLPIGFTLGAILSLTIQLKTLKNLNYSISFNINFNKITEAVAPLLGFVIVITAPQLNIIIDRLFAATLPYGNVAILDYASKFESMAVGLIAYAIVLPLYTKLSSAANNDNKEEFEKTLIFGLKSLIVSIIPVVTIIIVLREPIIRLLLERGNFSALNTYSVSETLLFLSPYHIAGGFVLLFLYALFALKEIRWLLGLAGIGITINIILNTILIKYLGLNGIALSTSLSMIPNTGVLWFYLRKKSSNLKFLYFKDMLIKVSFSSILAGYLSLKIYNYTFNFHKLNNSPGIFLSISSAILISLVFYLFLCLIFRVEEIQKIWVSVTKKISPFPPLQKGGAKEDDSPYQ
ncbi:MAG: polysaccharide biosynthesis C-terminal domain-containing protein [Actinobacteria bacterium]|nr:polysaccharide biosynthesis C-terminal domain-containing protein [Actinomycetota bacterium]